MKFLIEQAGDINIGGGTHKGSVDCSAGANSDGEPLLECEVTG